MVFDVTYLFIFFFSYKIQCLYSIYTDLLYTVIHKLLNGQMINPIVIHETFTCSLGVINGNIYDPG